MQDRKLQRRCSCCAVPTVLANNNKQVFAVEFQMHASILETGCSNLTQPTWFQFGIKI